MEHFILSDKITKGVGLGHNNELENLFFIIPLNNNNYYVCFADT